MYDLEHKKSPEYVLQSNAISRSVYDLSTNARRLIGMAMALIPHNAKEPKDYRVKFSVSEFEKALGMARSSGNRERILAAVRECLHSTIEISLPNGEWMGWTWFIESRLEYELHYEAGIELDHITIDDDDHSNDSCWSNIVMEFNYHLGEALKQFKRAYSEIRLENLGRLQSKYAIRFYEIAQSYAGFAGKDGNQKDTWYFDYSIMELRTIFGISKSKYKVTSEFRRNIVEQPIEEVNAAGIGLHIKVEYERRGRKLAGFRFICRRIAAGEPVPADTTERLRDKHPERFRELLAEAEQQQQQQEFLFSNISAELKQKLAETKAEERLAAEQPKKRGRPRKAAAS